MQENGTEQPKVYRRTRSMLKIRCTLTEVEQTRYRNSQSTETEKAEFHTPAIPNMARNHCSITLHVNCKIAVFREHSSTYHGKDGYKG